MVRDRWSDGWTWSWWRPINGGTVTRQLEDLTAMLRDFHLSDDTDEWRWRLGDLDSFTVKETRKLMDQINLPDCNLETRWCRYIPRKVNILVWRVLRDRIPTRWNLSRKGVDLDTLLCPFCSKKPEEVDHVLWSCEVAASVWLKIFKWVDIVPPIKDKVLEVFGWLDDLHIQASRKAILESILGVVLWVLWRFRNDTIFGDNPVERGHFRYFARGHFRYLKRLIRRCVILVLNTHPLNRHTTCQLPSIFLFSFFHYPIHIISLSPSHRLQHQPPHAWTKPAEFIAVSISSMRVTTIHSHHQHITGPPPLLPLATNVAVRAMNSTTYKLLLSSWPSVLLQSKDPINTRFQPYLEYYRHRKEIGG